MIAYDCYNFFLCSSIIIYHFQMQILYLGKTHMPTMHVNDAFLLCLVWTDQLVKRRLTAEIESFGNYGQVDVSL